MDPSVGFDVTAQFNTEDTSLKIMLTSDSNYLLTGPLKRQIETEALELAKRGCRNQIIVDIGCGNKPYRKQFSSLEGKYYGLDINNNGFADVCAAADNLPFEDASVDIVLCTQVLEHCRYPDKVLSEISRILHPGGVALVSTHGIYIYHPAFEDYWRWTHEGLKVQFKSAGLEATKVLPNGGPIACLFYLVITLLALFSSRSRWLAWISRLFIALLNFLGEKLDKISIKYFFPTSEYLLVANYLVVSKKPNE